MSMDFSHSEGHLLGLEMETEDNYRIKAADYRNSVEYSKMISLYPVLKTSINDCENEVLVA